MDKAKLISCASGISLENDYKIDCYIGSGAIGHMFRCYNKKISDERAVKLIPIENLRDGWENEIIKVNKLKNQEDVVRYHTHGGPVEIDGKKYTYIMWDYVSNDSLKKLIEAKKLTLPMLVDVIKATLRVLHACHRANIIHADLHSGNVLVEKENELNVDPAYRKIWITDFGYISQDSDREYLDDFMGLDRMMQDGLRSIDFHGLDGGGKHTYLVLKHEFSKYLIETNVTVDVCVRNPSRLLDRLNELLNKNVEEEKNKSYGISDYLAAETLGEDFEEWKNIFVPKFIAIDELLEKIFAC